jgi:hypothetical protein
MLVVTVLMMALVMLALFLHHLLFPSEYKLNTADTRSHIPRLAKQDTNRKPRILEIRSWQNHG